MAGDWIKLEAVTPDKPEVYSLAHKLGIDRDTALGKVVRLFIWYDQHLQNGNAGCVTETTITSVIGNADFARALQEVGWLRAADGGLMVVNFDRHNGKPAKKRAQMAVRLKRFRNAAGVTREEKRREEKNKNKTTAGGFAPPPWLPLESWKAYSDMRVKQRKPLTPKACELAVAKLAHLKAQGFDPQGVLEQSVLNSWAGLFEIKPEGGANMAAPRMAAVNRICAYCDKPATATANNTPACGEHFQDALFHKEKPQL